MPYLYWILVSVSSIVSKYFFLLFKILFFFLFWLSLSYTQWCSGAIPKGLLWLLLDCLRLLLEGSCSSRDEFWTSHKRAVKKAVEGWTKALHDWRPKSVPPDINLKWWLYSILSIIKILLTAQACQVAKIK